MHRRVARDDGLAAQHVRAAFDRGHDSARFADEHHAGGHVPRREAELPERVEPAGRHVGEVEGGGAGAPDPTDRKSTRLNSSHSQISYAVFCLKKKKTNTHASYTAEQTPPRPKHS